MYGLEHICNEILYLKRARWLDGVKSEDDWADMMTRLAKWQIDWEEEHGQTGVLDFHAE